MRRRLFAVVMIVTGVAWLAATSSAEAGDWMFRRSYYSHNAGPNVLDDAAPSRAAYREPWVGAHPRFAVRRGWRFNSFVLEHGTTSVDMSCLRENSYDVNYEPACPPTGTVTRSAVIGGAARGSASIHPCTDEAARPRQSSSRCLLSARSPASARPSAAERPVP